MDDITLSILVVICTVAVAGFIFTHIRQKTKQREEALAEYCDGKGYRLTITKEPTTRLIVVESDQWALTSSMRTQQNSSSSGSTDWQSETVWICNERNPMRETFALQVSAGSTDIETLPPWVRDRALQAMRLMISEEMKDLTSVRTAFHDRNRTGIVFEKKEYDAEKALLNIRAPLSEWRGGLPLFAEASPEHVRLYFSNCAVKTADEISTVLEIGNALIG